jgi:hypothetical protein
MSELDFLFITCYFFGCLQGIFIGWYVWRRVNLQYKDTP